MEAATPSTICPSCGVDVAPTFLACPACKRLVNAERLKALAADAEAAEREGRVGDALSHWRAAHELLPPASKQHRAVGDTIRRLSEAVDKGGGAAAPRDGTGKALAGAGALAAMVWKLKFVFLSLLTKAKLLLTGLTSLPTLLSMGAWLALDRSRGATFVVGLVLSIYVHEMGHVAALRHYGIKATPPMFIPGLGALVRLRQYPIDAREDARIGLAGPVWGAAAAAAALGLGVVLREPTLLKIASLGATINVFNLIPVWQLDGARGFRALDARQRDWVTAMAVLTAVLLDEHLGWAVAGAGFLRRGRDLPPAGEPRAFRTFLTLLAVLALIGWLGAKGGPLGR